jgi:hypothetical protein
MFQPVLNQHMHWMTVRTAQLNLLDDASKVASKTSSLLQTGPGGSKD